MIIVKYDLNEIEQVFDSFGDIPNYDNVVYLNCSNNHLKSLSELPNSLIRLWCYDNQLSSLPELPNSLQFLCCCYNQLSSLPQLPNSLQILSCWDNQLSSLPELPKSLKTLYCNNNQFVTKQEEYIQKIIYSISQNKNFFVNNLALELGEKCLECQKQFININKYRFEKLKNQDITIKNGYCQECSKNVLQHEDF